VTYVALFHSLIYHSGLLGLILWRHASSNENYNTSNSVGIWLENGSSIPEFFLFSTASRPALGPTQPPVQWEPWTLFPGVKRLGREANHSLPSSAEVENGDIITAFPHTSSWHSASLSTGTTLYFAFFWYPVIGINSF
jgi:hypothetical protein